MNMRKLATILVVALMVSAATLFVNGPKAYGAALTPYHTASSNPNLIGPGPGGGSCPTGYKSYSETYSGNGGDWTTQLYVTFHYPGQCASNVTVSFQTCWRDNHTVSSDISISVGYCGNYSNGGNTVAEEDFTISGEGAGSGYTFSTYQTISTDQYGDISYYQHPYP